MAPWPWSSSSSTSSSSSSQQHAPTGAPLPSTSHAQTSQFTVADPILPPATTTSSTSTSAPPSTPSSTSTPSLPPSSTSPSSSSPETTSDLPTPAPLNLRPLFLTLLITCPILAALPPRKLDLYTLGLAGAWVISVEEVGRGQRFGWSTFTNFRGGGDMGDGKRRDVGDKDGFTDLNGGMKADARTSQSQTQVKEGHEGEEGGITALARNLWMGTEKEGWKERRLAKEREDLAQGKGYSDLIGERIEEVFRESTEKNREDREGG